VNESESSPCARPDEIAHVLVYASTKISRPSSDRRTVSVVSSSANVLAGHGKSTSTPPLYAGSSLAPSTANPPGSTTREPSITKPSPSSPVTDQPTRSIATEPELYTSNHSPAASLTAFGLAITSVTHTSPGATKSSSTRPSQSSSRVSSSSGAPGYTPGSPSSQSSPPLSIESWPSPSWSVRTCPISATSAVGVPGSDVASESTAVRSA
jgi:hypothetical protein